jgi:aspartyl-tRNA(Asn)/glutamyl-tRNA(Gln) amidotransferase subunit B
MEWEVVIGLETHTQLSTVSKIFSGASTAFGAEPNTQASAICLALPGVLPVLNKGAVERAIQFGLAVGGRIAPRSIFARKNYFYPDLPKGYQISQYELPVVSGGEIRFRLKEKDRDTEKVVRLTRAHLEEDAGKSVHDAVFENASDVSGIDLNRAGTPLLEIVSEPDMRSAAEAVAYARTLHSLVVWLGICDGNLQEGSFRCDVNVSVRPKGQEKLGTRREIKNLNSFKFMQQAIDYEVRWQIGELEEGRAIQQATVLFNANTGETAAMRSKEDAMDYRYFPDPDLLPLAISNEWIERVRDGLPELPQAKRGRFLQSYGLSDYDAATLTASKAMADYFEAVVTATGGEPKTAANWVTGELSAALNRAEIDIESSPIPAGQLAGLLKRIADGTLSGKMAKEVFEAMWNNEGSADAIIEKRGLKQLSDSGEIEKIVDDVLTANPKSVEEFRAGKEKAFNALVGQVMKASKGKANPAQVNDILKRKLGS